MFNPIVEDARGPTRPSILKKITNTKRVFGHEKKFTLFGIF